MFAEHDPRLANVNVLIVDDDAPARAIVREVLRAIGIQHLSVASDGRAALRSIAERIRIDPDIPPFDVIVCDWQMPEVSGLELLKMVRRRYSQLPFVMLTAMRGVDDVRAAADAKVSAYVVKPVVPAELKRKVVGVLAAGGHI